MRLLSPEHPYNDPWVLEMKLEILYAKTARRLAVHDYFFVNFRILSPFYWSGLLHPGNSLFKRQDTSHAGYKLQLLEHFLWN